MTLNFEISTILIGILVFFARVFDVSLGTFRTISIVQGRTKIAFLIGFVEISMWLLVLSTVLNRVMNTPILGLFYALGFSTGNVVGIFLEKRIALGKSILRLITSQNGKKMAELIRESGYVVTTFQGEGKNGPVTELCIVCQRKNLGKILRLVQSIQKDVFYITEQVSNASKIYHPIMVPRTGWRAIEKKK